MKKAGILLVILVVPALIVIFLGGSGKKIPYLPIHGPKEVSNIVRNGLPVVDTIYHQVSFSNYKSYGLDTSSKIKVIHFLSSCQCEEECGKKFSRLVSIDGRIEKGEVVYIGFDVDSNDCREGIKDDYKYQSESKIIPIKRNEINSLLSSLLLNPIDTTKQSWRRYVSQELIILLDEENRVRGVFKGSSKKMIEDLRDQINILIKFL